MWIWSTNVQARCTWKWLANLRDFYATDTFYVSFHWGTGFTFALDFVVNSTIRSIIGYIIAAGQISHIILAINNWNVWFCWFKSVWLQPNFSKSVIFSISDSSTDEGRDLLEDILLNKMIRQMNLIVLLTVWW